MNKVKIRRWLRQPNQWKKNRRNYRNVFVDSGGFDLMKKSLFFLQKSAHRFVSKGRGILALSGHIPMGRGARILYDMENLYHKYNIYVCFFSTHSGRAFVNNAQTWNCITDYRRNGRMDSRQINVIPPDVMLFIVHIYKQNEPRWAVG